MKPKNLLQVFICCLPLSIALCLVAGCASQKTSKSSAHKTSKAPLPANQVPAAVQEALQSKFPVAKPVEWKLKSGNIYEAEFLLKGSEITVMFDSTGKWLETESAIDPGEVPPAVRDSAAKQFPGYRMIETQSVERWDESNLIYELHFENDKEIVKAQFSNQGAILKQAAKAKN